MLGAQLGPDSQDSTQLFANRVSLLCGHDYPGVFTPGIQPLRVEPTEIADVVSVEDTSGVNPENETGGEGT
jgi:hypothetical protein